MIQSFRGIKFNPFKVTVYRIKWILFSEMLVPTN